MIIPADLMLIESNLPDGICYKETGSLDGEKTLKIKSILHFVFFKRDSKLMAESDNLNDEEKNKNTLLII